jgi:hypothetical protein
MFDEALWRVSQKGEVHSFRPQYGGGVGWGIGWEDLKERWGISKGGEGLRGVVVPKDTREADGEVVAGLAIDNVAHSDTCVTANAGHDYGYSFLFRDVA